MVVFYILNSHLIRLTMKINIKIKSYIITIKDIYRLT